MSLIGNTITDRRGDTLDKHPVWKCVIDQMTWLDNETNEDTSNININGVITMIVAAYTAGSSTMTLKIQDTAGNQLYSTADADGQTIVKAADGTEFGQNQLAGDSFILSLTATNPGTTITADVTIYGV